MKRYLSIVILIVTLLLSMWSNVIAAGFCPRLAHNRDCHPKQVTFQPKPVAHQSCHREMTDSDMEGMQSEAPADSVPDTDVEASPMKFNVEATSDKLAFDLPLEPCSHCLSHSLPASGAASSTVAVDPSKRLVETNSPLADFAAVPLLAFQTIVPMEHGPPGQSSPRHILISVFRI